MRLTNTALVALQASMTLALIIPNEEIKKELSKQTDKLSKLSEPFDKDYHGYEETTKVTTYKYYAPKDGKQHLDEKEREHEQEDDRSQGVKEKDNDEDDLSGEDKHKAKGEHKEEEEEDESEDEDEDEEDEDEEDEEEEDEEDDEDDNEHPSILSLLHKEAIPYGQAHSEGKKNETKKTESANMHKTIHRHGKGSKRSIDIDIHAPTVNVYPDSDGKHGDLGKKVIDIHHGPVYKHQDEHKHGDEKKHTKLTQDKPSHHGLKKVRDEHLESTHRDKELKHSDAHDANHHEDHHDDRHEENLHGDHHDGHHKYHKVHHDNLKKILGLVKEHQSNHKPTHGLKESKHSQHQHDEGKKHDKLTNDHHSHDKPTYGLKETDHPQYPHAADLKHLQLPKDSHQKSGKDHPYHESDKDRPSHHKSTYRYKEHSEHKDDDGSKHIKLTEDHHAHHQPTHWFKVKHPDSFKETGHHDDYKKSEHHDDNDKFYKDHSSYGEPTYRYKEHSEYQHGDDKKHIKYTTKEHSLHHQPAYQDEEPKHHDDMKSHRHQNSHHESPSQHKEFEHSEYPHIPKKNVGQEDHTKHYDDRSGDRPHLKQGYESFHMKRTNKFDPNAPLPRLKTLHLLNIEALEPQDRKRIALGLPLDEETRKAFGEFEQWSCTPELITKLNAMYAAIIDDPKYRPFIDYINTKRKMVGGTGKDRKKRSVPRISSEALAKIDHMEPNLRRLAAEQLDFHPSLTKEFENCGKLTPEMIEKLNKEYARVYNDPKYMKIIEKFNSKSKRSETKDSKGENDSEEGDKKEKNYSKDKNDEKENDSDENDSKENDTKKGDKKKKEEEEEEEGDKKKENGSKEKSDNKKEEEPRKLTRKQLRKIGDLPEFYRSQAASALDFPKDLKKEFTMMRIYRGKLLDRLNKEYARCQKDPKYADFIKKLEKFAKRKRSTTSTHELTDEQLEKLGHMSEHDRQAVAKALDLDEKLAQEFINASDTKKKELTARLVRKVNEAYTRKSADLGDIKKDARKKIAKDLNFDKALENEFVDAKELSVSLLEKLGHALDITIENLKSHITLDKLFDSAQHNHNDEKAEAKKLGKRTTDDKLKDKLDESKKNGWCPEFIGELETTWDKEEAVAKIENKVEQKVEEKGNEKADEKKSG